MRPPKTKLLFNNKYYKQDIIVRHKDRPMHINSLQVTLLSMTWTVIHSGADEFDRTLKVFQADKDRTNNRKTTTDLVYSLSYRVKQVKAPLFVKFKNTFFTSTVKMYVKKKQRQYQEKSIIIKKKQPLSTT